MFTDILLIFKDLHSSIKRVLLNLFILFSFWVVAIYIFKPQIVNESIYVQFFLSFCLAILWSFSYLTITTGVMGICKKVTTNIAIEFSTFLGVSFISLYIFVGYYYSMCFTEFLRLCFWSTIALYIIPGVVLFLLQQIIGIISRCKKE